MNSKKLGLLSVHGKTNVHIHEIVSDFVLFARQEGFFLPDKFIIGLSEKKRR